MGIDFGARLKDITDGSSKTMILGEYLRSRGGPVDQRGMIWGDQPAYGSVYTQLSPNSGSPDLIYQGWCDNQPNANLPCIKATPAQQHRRVPQQASGWRLRRDGRFLGSLRQRRC